MGWCTPTHIPRSRVCTPILLPRCIVLIRIRVFHLGIFLVLAIFLLLVVVGLVRAIFLRFNSQCLRAMIPNYGLRAVRTTSRCMTLTLATGIRSHPCIFQQLQAAGCSSVEKKARAASWSEFCKMLLERFGKKHHELLIRQMFHIKHVGSVAEYVERFSELVD